MLDLEDKKILDEFILEFEISDIDAKTLYKKAVKKSLNKGALIYPQDDCCGYMIVKNGIIRAYIASLNLKEITIFRLKSGERCIMCQTCTISSFETEVSLQIEKDCEILLIPADFFKELKDRYPSVANHALKLVSDKFAKVVNVMEQALFSSLTNRIKDFLIENSSKNEIKITHEQLANHLGSAREAVSRILKEMEAKNQISQKRGVIFLNKF